MCIYGGRQQPPARETRETTLMDLLLSEVSSDLLGAISKRLIKLEDFISFRCVSRSLYAAVKEDYFEGPRLPYLLQPVQDDDDVRELYSLIPGESIAVASVKVSNFKDKKCSESLGWLLTVEADGNMALVDPFSGREIPLPHVNAITEPQLCTIKGDQYMFIQKMVLSARPDETSDFILMVICGCYQDLAFWRLGDKAWTRITQRKGKYHDVVYFGHGKFYAIGYPGHIWVFEIGKQDNSVRGECLLTCQPLVPFYGISLAHLPDFRSMKLYLLKALNGSLLIITRTNARLREDRSSCLTTRFQVYDIDESNRTWKEIYSLGRMAVFVGHNSTFALDAAGFPGGAIKASHIYFTDDDWNLYYYLLSDSKGGGLNIGVYNMETGTIKPFYHGEPMVSKVSTSLWINAPSPMYSCIKNRRRRNENTFLKEVK